MVGARVPGEIAAWVARGAAVLTATQGAARVLRGDLAEESIGAGGPLVMTWGAWVRGLWSRALLCGASEWMLLNRTQEEAIWRRLVEGDAEVSTLRGTWSLARLAAEAWRELAQHRGLRRLPGSATNGDTATFVRLAGRFEEECRRHGYLSEARLEEALRKVIAAGGLVIEDKGLLLVGFDRVTPAQRALLDVVQAAGVAVETVAPGTPSGLAEVMVFDTPGEEIRAVARDCRSYLEEHPRGRLGLLVPDLGAEASEVERVLREVLAPEMEDILAPGVLPYEIGMAAGRPLAEAAMVAEALDLLGWVAGPLGLDRVSGLLVTGKMGGAGEARARAEFDAFELRRTMMLRPEIGLDWLVGKLARSPRRGRLVGLVGTLREMLVVGRRLASGRKPWSGWAEAMREMLGAAGWGVEPAADAAEFEVRRAWESALDELATLDFDGSVASYEEALAALRGIAGDTVQPMPVGGAPVQVITPAESAGMRFDAVWFLRAGDRSWPVPVGGSPLIGWPLRRELGLPGSDVGADRAQARQVTERIVGCAERVVFSYARETGEEVQRIAPVLAGLTRAERPVGVLEACAPEVALEAVADRSRISPPPDVAISGGAAVLKAQAACGFRAFAEWRLSATGLEPREPGMNARERGDAVHRVLERFWKKVESQAALRRMTAQEREAGLLAAIEWALAEAAREAETRWDGAYLETQRQRLLRLGQAWLALDAARGLPFEVVRRESGTGEVTIGPLRLKLRIDRMDRTEQGAVLIDYKTGEAGPGKWIGERPDEPQLPLYAVVAAESRLHAIAFGNVRAGQKMELSGYEQEKGTLTKAAKLVDAASLEEQIEVWHGVLERLATDFWNGDTRVSPKEFPKTCVYCAQRLICRLDAGALSGSDEEDAEEGLDG